MERCGIIYKATSPSGKVYIGKTINSLEERKISHFEKINSNTKFARALRKYPDQEKWDWSILYKNIPENQLDIAEICTIYVYDSFYEGYNSTFGGDGGNTWNGLSFDEKQRIRNVISEHSKQMTGIKSSQFGTKRSQEHIQKMVIGRSKVAHPNQGKHLPEVHRKNISLANSGSGNGMFGKHHSDHTKQLISEANKKIKDRKSVYQIWVEKYGIEMADEMEKARREKISLKAKGRKKK